MITKVWIVLLLSLSNGYFTLTEPAYRNFWVFSSKELAKKFCEDYINRPGIITIDKYAEIGHYYPFTVWNSQEDQELIIFEQELDSREMEVEKC